MEGYEDPFNRGTFPWGREDRTLQDWFVRLGALRNARPSLQAGSLRWLHAQGPVLAFARDGEGETTVAAVNAGPEAVRLDLPWSAPLAVDALTEQRFLASDGVVRLTLPPRDAVLLI